LAGGAVVSRIEWEVMTMQENVVIHREFPLHRRTTAPSFAGPIFEAVTYAGAALALAALGTWVYPRWLTWSGAVQPILPGVAAITLLALGWLIRDEDNPIARRLTGAVWGFAALFVGWFVFALTQGTAGYAGPWVPLIVTGSTAVVALGLWVVHRHSLQLITLIGAVLATAYVGLALLLTPADWMYAITFAGIGVGVIALAAVGLMPPRITAYATGSVVPLIAPLVAITIVTEASTPIRTWVYVGIGLAVALAVAGVLLRSVPMRILAAIGLLGYVAALIQRYYVEPVALGLTLAIVGVVMLVGALVALWMYEPGMKKVAEERPAAPIEEEREGKIAL
jgi:hypothetical protein